MDRPSLRAAELGEIVKAAGEVAMQGRGRLVSELKKDGSIVTNADRDVETWLRPRLTELVPGSSVWGEEFGHDGMSEHGLWLVDPVDGTSNFSFGSPLWGVSVALMVEDRIVLGAISLPDLGELYLAEHGQGAFKNGDRIPAIPPGPIRDHELLSYGEGVAKFLGSRKAPGKQRLSGAFVVDGTFTAVQRYRGLIGIRERLYDVAACLAICAELDA
ncbi:MAG TPA: inositol monophosphatase family protein, partial [Fimbriimonas sp.]|nr:inositol monophosphatase family protein [Fimbriimonas sp.]